MNIVSFHVDGALRANRTQILACTATSTLLHVHNRNHGNQTAVHLLAVGTNPASVFVLAVFVVGGNQLDGASGTSA